MFNPFEQPWGLLIAAVVVLLILLIFRHSIKWWLWLLPAIMVIAAFGFDFLVETDREKIDAVINTAVLAVENENPDAIESIIADNYRDSYHMTKDVFMSYCRAMLCEPIIEKNIKRIVSMDIQPSKATAIFTVRILFDKDSYVYQSLKSQMLTKVQLDLQKEPRGQWLINRLELLAINLQPVNWRSVGQAGQ
ncbi:MAG: hypothetical protein PHY02_07860 [Phycisphaerae bacterium]|nr:hypothetical protein [Phycisphaerae bacterium]